MSPSSPRLGPAIVRSLPVAVAWALGVAAGVTAGGYLTAVSGSGAPGSSSLDTVDLVQLPSVAAVAVFALVLVVATAVRMRRMRAASATEHSADDQHHDEQRDTDGE